MKGFSVLLLLLGLSRTNSQRKETSCQEVKDNLCITSDSFTTWDDARDHCIDLGGDLAVPRRNASEMQKLLQTSVWVGGRATRVWIKDNSWYYYGVWEGCVVDTDTDITFQPSEDLSECLQSCSRFEYAYVKTSMCGCYNAKYKVDGHGDTCLDPYAWNASLQEIPPTHVHLFEMMATGNRKAQERCGQIERPRNKKRLQRKTTSCSSLKLPLCQFANISSTRDHVNYGQSYLLTADNNETWDAGRQNCSRDGGSLAKLDWESPMLREKLLKEFGDVPVWVGLGRVGWYFIDGSPVNSTWPEFNKKDGECLVQGPTGLGSAQCDGQLALRAACTLTTRSAEDSYSGVSLGVGVGIGIIAAVAVGIGVACWIRKKKSNSVARSRPANHNQQGSSGFESISFPEQNAAETSTQMNTYAKLHQNSASATTRPPDYESIDDIITSKGITTNGETTKQGLSEKQNIQDTPNPKDGQESASILWCPPKNQHQLGIPEETSMGPTNSHGSQEKVSYLELSSNEKANSDQSTPVSTHFPKNQDQQEDANAIKDVDNEAAGMGPPEDNSAFYLVLTRDEQAAANSDQPTSVSAQLPKNQDKLDIPKATIDVDKEASGIGPPEDNSAFYFTLTRDEQAAANSDQPTSVSAQLPKNLDQLDIPKATMDVDNEVTRVPQIHMAEQSRLR